MQRSLTRFLLSSSVLFLSWSCTPYWKKWPSADTNVQQVQQLRPYITVGLYNTTVDVVGNHLSGLLLVKKMPDSSIRMVFTNEMGFTFFDFEFDTAGNFKVHSIIKKMDKRSVLKTLRNDFELVWMLNLPYSAAHTRLNNGLLYYIYPKGKGFYFYITDPQSTRLVRMERASAKKAVVEAHILYDNQEMPDSIGIEHKTFEFKIGLKRIER